MVSSAGHGAGFGSVRLYGNQGVVILDSGQAQRDGSEPQNLEELTRSFLDGSLPEDAMAHSFAELYALITVGKPPISSGERALEALAIVYACLEASLMGHPVQIADVLLGTGHAYEDTIEVQRSQWVDVDPERVS